MPENKRRMTVNEKFVYENETEGMGKTKNWFMESGWDEMRAVFDVTYFSIQILQSEHTCILTNETAANTATSILFPFSFPRREE